MHVDFVGLTIAAAIAMGAVRAMPSSISFVERTLLTLTRALSRTQTVVLALARTPARSLSQVRAMLSNISFVYDHYYGLPTAISGVLISAPTMAGFISALLAAHLAKLVRSQ